MRENLRMNLDPFSDLLQLLNARSVLAGGLVTGGKWAVEFPASDQIKFWGIVRGNCSMQMGGEQQPVAVESGDVFLLRTPRSHVLSSDSTLEPVPLAKVLANRQSLVVQHGEGDEFFMIGGKLELADNSAQVLINELPMLIHIRATSRHAGSLRWLLEQLVNEQEGDHPGAAAATSQLTHLMFIQILRAYFEQSAPLEGGRLRAMGDKRLAPALRLIHQQPARAWQLEELAKSAAMSRATFAAYFKKVAGIAPMAYLTEWRMRLAERVLQNGRTSVSALALSLGYGSESAFSNAFKRIIGQSPRHYQQEYQAPVVSLDQIDTIG